MLGFLLAAIVGAAAQMLLQAIIYLTIRIYQTQNGEFTGAWYSICPASDSDLERRDRLRIRQRGHQLFVLARRYMPIAERGRVWKMRGYSHGNVLIALFYTTTPRHDPTSYGVLLLHRDSTIREASVWRGTYLRPNDNDLPMMVSGNSRAFPIVWQQGSPEKNNYANEDAQRNGTR